MTECCDNCQELLDKTRYVMGAVRYCVGCYDAYMFDLGMTKKGTVEPPLRKDMIGFLHYLEEHDVPLTVAEERFLVEYAARS